MPKYRTPECYRAPLKSRADIAAFLAEHRSYRCYPHDYCRFVWDVKLYDVNMEYDHLLQVHRQSGYDNLGEKLDHPEVQEIYREKHSELMDDYELERIAQQDAWDDVNGTDCFNHLWDGTNCDAKFSSYGRSSGYVGLNTFLGYYNFTKEDDDYWNVVFRGNPHRRGTQEYADWEYDYAGMSYADLRLLYRFVVMLNHDFTREKACIEVEHDAAYHLFARHEDEVEEEWVYIRQRDIHIQTSRVMEELLAA